MRLSGPYKEVDTPVLREAGGPPFQCWLKPYELWVPRPCVFCKGGYDDVRIMRFSPKSIPALQTLQPTLREERVPRTDSNRSRRCKLGPWKHQREGPHLMVPAAPYPPLQKTQERGTHCIDSASEIKSLGHPPKAAANPTRIKALAGGPLPPDQDRNHL